MPLSREILKINGKRYPSGMGYAILGSTIYCISRRFPPNEPSLDVYIFDTKKNNEKSLTKLGPRLNTPKYYLNVVVIQGKIYVFPYSFAKDASLLDLRFSILLKEHGLLSLSLIGILVLQTQRNGFHILTSSE